MAKKKIGGYAAVYAKAAKAYAAKVYAKKKRKKKTKKKKSLRAKAAEYLRKASGYGDYGV